jgi:zinc finger HIT domain-containing protein 1
MSSSSNKAPVKRSSSRTSVLSKAMRVIDAEQRQEVRSKRLIALEADNYNETQTIGENNDAYEDEVDGDEPTTKKMKVSKAASKKSKQKARKIRSLDRIIDHQLYMKVKEAQPESKAQNDDGNDRGEENRLDEGIVKRPYIYTSSGQTINYLSVAAPPSVRPPRQFCSVCGYFGSYSCVRCGMRFCSIRCNKSHKETRCLQLSI